MANRTSSNSNDRPATASFDIAPDGREHPPGATLRASVPCQEATPAARSPSIGEQWLALHGDALFRYALLLVGDEHHAEDLVQETLLGALRSHAHYSAAASERTWLIAILRHKALDDRRRNRRLDQYLAEADPAVEGNFNRFGKWRKPPGRWSPAPDALVESQEFRTVFQSCMTALPTQMREAFALRVVEGLDAAETCKILEITSANLWTLLYRARERLRRCLEGKWFSKEEH